MIVGHAIDDDDMHWTVECPQCDKELEYTGYFDSSDENKCTCGCVFKTERLYLENGGYIK